MGGEGHAELLRRECPTTESVGQRPSARQISQEVFGSEPGLEDPRMSMLLVFWGQLVAHDIVLSQPKFPKERMPIDVPAGDQDFDPDGEGDVTLAFTRNAYGRPSPDAPRMPASYVTSMLDGSAIYGSGPRRGSALRSGEGGRLLLGADGLPEDAHDLQNDRNDRREGEQLVVAGDTRANENVAILALHTILVLEHNRIAEQLAGSHPDWSDDELFTATHRLVVAIMQRITYEEYLPAMLGEGAMPPYAGYRPHSDHRPSALFTGAAFRLAHSQIPPELRILPGDRPVPIEAATFRPSLLVEAGGAAELLERLGRQSAERVDLQVTDALRGNLFGTPRFGGIDLIAIDIQRGRDLQLPSYAEARACLGLPVPRTWAELDVAAADLERLQAAYRSVDLLDVFPGALTEGPVSGAIVGPLFWQVLRDGFVRLRDGDQNWYESRLTADEAELIRTVTLQTLIESHSQ